MDRNELQAVMEDRGWSQSELARQIGTSPEVVSRWIKGKNKMSDAKSKELQRVLYPKKSENDEVKQLLREKISWLEQMLDERATEIDNLKKRISTLETKSSLPTLRTANG